jgi:hypothetical protein
MKVLLTRILGLGFIGSDILYTIANSTTRLQNIEVLIIFTWIMFTWFVARPNEYIVTINKKSSNNSPKKQIIPKSNTLRRLRKDIRAEIAKAGKKARKSICMYTG